MLDWNFCYCRLLYFWIHTFMYSDKNTLIQLLPYFQFIHCSVVVFHYLACVLIDQNHVLSCCYMVWIWMYCDVHCLDTQMCSEWHVVFLNVWADSQTVWLSTGDWRTVALRNTQPRIPSVEAGYWTPPPPGLVYLSSHNALENRKRRGMGVWILQPNGHVFTLGCFLISHCNENNIKNRSLATGASL